MGTWIFQYICEFDAPGKRISKYALCLHLFNFTYVQLVNKLNACIIFVDYSLSPEVRYPVALEECYTALCWTRDNAKSIHVDPTRLAVCGDSAGGNLATALASKWPCIILFLS
jgi:hypothetical protein